MTGDTCNYGSKNSDLSTSGSFVLCGGYQYGGITDLLKAFSQLQNQVKISQEEIKSLHQIIEQLEKRLEQLEEKGNFGKVQILSEVPTLHPC